MSLGKKGGVFGHKESERGCGRDRKFSITAQRKHVVCECVSKKAEKRVSESNEKEFVKGELFVILIYVSDTLMAEWHAVVLLLHHCKLLMATSQRQRAATHTQSSSI